MKMERLNCPYCGASIDVNVQGRTNVFCSYCGQQIQLEDNKREFIYNKNVNVTKTIHKRYTNDADVIRANNEEAKDKRDSKQLILIMCVAFLIPILLFGSLLLNQTINQAQGKISAGYYKDLVGEDYKTVEAHFKAAGFTNIELIDLNDSGIAFWNDGKVAIISVGGNTDFETVDWFDPDTVVVISYH